MEQQVKKHSVLSNILYVFKPTAKSNPGYLAAIAAEAVLFVLAPVMASGCSSLVIAMLGEELSLPVIAASILAVFMVYGIVNGMHTYFSVSNNYAYIDMRVWHEFDIVQKTITTSQEQFESSKIRRLGSKALGAVGGNRDGVEGIMRDTGKLLANVLGLAVYMLIVGGLNYKILIMLLVLSVIGAYISGLPIKIFRKIENDLAQQWRVKEYINRVVDNVSGGKDIRVFGLSRWLIGKYETAIAARRRLSFSHDTAVFLTDLSDSVLSALRNLVCYLYLIGRLQEGMSVAQFVFYLGLIGGFAAWFSEISRLLVDMKKSSHMVDNFRAYVDLESGMADEGEIPQNKFQDIEVVFDHVSYRYEDAEEPTLKDVSFTLKKGEHLALVGLNGAGKSTLVKLMSGLYLPVQGKVYVNGVDTRELNRAAYLKRIAAVFQEHFVTSYSVGENVALNEEYDEERVWQALRDAGLDEKIASLPEGLETCLGKDISEHGVSLSGGETQKLLLARALYRNPELVLLDEPTAALDAIAESNIYRTYNRTLDGKAVLFISHRLASTRFCKRILLLERGEIREEGTHQELMEKNGIYAELFRVQSKYYQEAEENDK